MRPQIARGVSTGITFAVFVIFMLLIGIVTVLGYSARSLTIFLLLSGLATGIAAGRAALSQDKEWGASLLRGLVAGLVTGTLSAATVLVIAGLNDNGVNMRTYLVQLSPESAAAIAFNRTPLVGALYYIGLLTLGSLLGSVLRRQLSYAGWGASLSGAWKAASGSITNTPAMNSVIGSKVTRYILIAIIVAVLFIAPQKLNQLHRYVVGTVGIYAMMGLGLNIVVGLAGLLDLGYVVFFAIGSYTVALLTAPVPHNLAWSFWATIPVAVALAVLFGVLLGVPLLRLRGDYLAIVTLGFGEIIAVLIKSDMLADYLNGANGVPGVALPTLPPLPRLPASLGGEITKEEQFVYLILIGVAIAIFISERLQNSRVGRAWIAIREDETVAQAMGINTLFYKLLAFGIGGAFAGMGGVLFASRNQFTGPEDMKLIVSINILSLVIVGGMGSIPGVILGAFVLKGLPELMRELETYRFLAFGALLVVMMLLRPQGIWPSARRRLEMHMDEEPPLDDFEAPTAGEAAG